MPIRRVAVLLGALALVACASTPEGSVEESVSNVSAQCMDGHTTSGLNLRREPKVDAANVITVLPANTRTTIRETSADGNWYRVSTALGDGWVSKSYVACDLGGVSPPPSPPTSRAGADFTPATCASCMRVKDGELRLPDGPRFVALGANLPMLRDGEMTGTDWSELAYRHVKVVRMFAAGGNLASADPSSPWAEDWANKVAARVDEAASRGFRVIVSFADYYHALPGEELVGDNAAKAEWCSMSVRPWPWYRRGTTRFDFDSACEGKTLRGAPNYEVVYKPFALQIVRRLKDHPGVFGWSIGNELRALGRGGKGAYGVSQGAAIDTFASFLEDMIGSIRAIDQNHLIIPGVQNLTEVSDDQAHGSTWNAALERMAKVPFDVWNITMYNDNPNARADIAAFRGRGVPVIATEYDYWAPLCNTEVGAKMGDHACSVMHDGLSMVAPWARSEMQSVCPNTADAWNAWGALGEKVSQHGGCP